MSRTRVLEQLKGHSRSHVPVVHVAAPRLQGAVTALQLRITLVFAEFLGNFDNFCCALNLSSSVIFLSITIF